MQSEAGVLAALMFAASMWFYVQRVLIPHQIAEAAKYGIPRGNLSDLYPRWLGARELLLHHRNPYSAEITREIQAGYYGRPLDPARPHDPRDQQGFAYPVYVVFLLAPTISLPFAIVEESFCWFLIFLSAASVPIWLRAMRWKVSSATLVGMIALTLGSFQLLQAIKLQQLSLLVAGLIALSALLLSREHFVFAGILLAVASIKPQITLPVSAWLLLWTLSDWKARSKFFWGFAGTLSALFIGARLVLSGWPAYFAAAVADYNRYNQGAYSILETALGLPWGRITSIVVALAVAVFAWSHRRASAGSLEHFQVTALVLAATVLVMPKTAPYNQVLLLPGVLLVLQRSTRVWKASFPRRVTALICAGLVAWPWLASFALFATMRFHAADQFWALPLVTVLAIPLAVLILVQIAITQQAGQRST